MKRNEIEWVREWKRCTLAYYQFMNKQMINEISALLTSDNIASIQSMPLINYRI